MTVAKLIDSLGSGVRRHLTPRDRCTTVVQRGAQLNEDGVIIVDNAKLDSEQGDGKTESTVRVSVTLDRSDYSEIRGIAKQKRVSIAWVVRDAIADYLHARAPLFSGRIRRESL